MNHIVSTYQCQWKTTIENPDRVKRFRQFINTEQSDTSLVYVMERGQRRPATPEERELELATPAVDGD